MKTTQHAVTGASGPVITLVDEILGNPVTGVPLPSTEAVRSIAIGSGSPVTAVRSYAGNRFDHAMAGERSQLASAMSSLTRERDRLKVVHGSVVDENLETDRNDAAYRAPRPLTSRQKLSIGVNALALTGLIVASAATIQAVALDTGIATSAAQAIGFGIVPPIGALALANLVCGVNRKSSYRKAKRAVQAAAALLVPGYVVLFVEVFGAGATQSVTDMLDGLAGGGASGGEVAGKAFFGVSILFDVIAGAGFKIAIEETLRSRECPSPKRSGVYAEQETEITHRGGELGVVEDRMNRVTARIAEIDAGRNAYIDEVLALLHSGRSEIERQAPEPNLWTMEYTTHNGRMS